MSDTLVTEITGEHPVLPASLVARLVATDQRNARADAAALVEALDRRAASQG